MKKKMVQRGIAILTLICMVGGMTGCGCSKNIEEPKNPTTALQTTAAETADSHQGEKISYLTGEYVPEKQAQSRPIAVMINNIENAIPQSGISSAQIIYEAPVEGAITRMMAVFDRYENLKRIGSIRSCRLYYPKFANEWNAIYVHFGQSKYALDFLRSGAVDTVSSLNHEASFYRESGKVAPHNLYATGSALQSGIKAMEYKTKYDKKYSGHMQFAKPGETVTLAKGRAAGKVEIGYQINRPWFEYNAKGGQYYRFQYGGKHIDDLNNKQLHCSNIVIQCVNATLYPDGKSLNMTLTGSGSGWFITKGKAQKITWKKDSDLGQTKYLNQDGEEITLNTGKTWFCIVQNEYADNITFSK